jgi:hypothetical protein
MADETHDQWGVPIGATPAAPAEPSPQPEPPAAAPGPTHDDFGVPLQASQERHARMLQEARQRASNEGENAAHYIGTRSIPFASSGIGAMEAMHNREAQERVAEGTANFEHYRTVALQERQQQIESERGLVQKIGGALATIPAIAGETAAAGPLVGRAATAIGGALPAATRLGRIGQYAVQQAIAAPAMPSLYLQDWQERGGRAQDLVPSLANAALANIVLGAVGKVTPQNITNPATRALFGGGTMAGGSAVSHALEYAIGTSPNAGVLGHLWNGRYGEAAQQATVDAVTGAAFSFLHSPHKPEHGQQVIDDFADHVRSYREAGYSAAEAARRAAAEVKPPEPPAAAAPEQPAVNAPAEAPGGPPASPATPEARIAPETAQAVPERSQEAAPVADPIASHAATEYLNGRMSLEEAAGRMRSAKERMERIGAAAGSEDDLGARPTLTDTDRHAPASAPETKIPTEETKIPTEVSIESSEPPKTEPAGAKPAEQLHTGEVVDKPGRSGGEVGSVQPSAERVTQRPKKLEGAKAEGVTGSGPRQERILKAMEDAGVVTDADRPLLARLRSGELRGADKQDARELWDRYVAATSAPREGSARPATEEVAKHPKADEVLDRWFEGKPATSEDAAALGVPVRDLDIMRARYVEGAAEGATAKSHATIGARTGLSKQRVKQIEDQHRGLFGFTESAAVQRGKEAAAAAERIKTRQQGATEGMSGRKRPATVKETLESPYEGADKLQRLTDAWEKETDPSKKASLEADLLKAHQEASESGTLFHRGPRPQPHPGSQTASMPTPISGEAAEKIGAGILRHRNAELAQRREREANDLASGIHFYDVHTGAAPDVAERTRRFLEYADARESGNLANLPEQARKAAETARRLVEERGAELEKRELVERWIENYMGHLWKDPRHPEATPYDIWQKFQSKRTLTGPEGFRKQRKIPTYREGIEAGLEPAEWNPVRLEQRKLDEMDRSIFGHDTWNESKDQGINKFVPLGKRGPEGWTQAPDRLATVLAPGETKVKEFFDKQQMEGLEKFAKDNGINIKTSHKGEAGQITGNEIIRRLGTPEEVLAHEIGHWIDKTYNLDAWAKNPSLKPELEALADLRASGRVSAEYQAYLRSEPELIANLVAAYMHAPELLKQTAPNAHALLESLIQSNAALRPLASIKPSLQLDSRNQALRLAGPMLTGHYYMPKEVAQLFENHLSEGLGKNPAFRAFRGLGNQLNMFQLGWSAFHGVGTGLNAQFSAISQALRMASRGDFAAAARKIPGSLIPGWEQVAAIRQGLQMRREYFKPGSTNSETAESVKWLIEGGQRAKMDSFYGGGLASQWKSAFDRFRAGGLGRTTGTGAEVVMKAIPALNELVSKPILGHQVPLTKMAVMADMARYELGKLGPNVPLNVRREVLSKIADSVDNRFGELVYDNLFWKRTWKDLSLAGIRSVGWNLGTWRELGGAVKDIPASGRGLVRGEGISNRLAYLTALTMGTGMVGAMYGYLFGKPPQELKDYFFPQTGRTRRDGSPDRISLPTYMRDIYAVSNRADEGPFRIGENLFKMAKGKLNPAVTTLTEMLSNEDFFGAAIRNPNDSIVRQTSDTFMHLLTAFEPIASRSLRQQMGQGAGALPAASSFVGVAPAPSYITRTWEQQRAIETGRHSQMTPQERLRRSRGGR